MFPTELLITLLWCLIGGVACFFTAILTAGYRKPRPSLSRRCEYAAINGLGAMALGFLSLKYFPDEVRPEDIPAYSILCGISGLQRVLDFVMQRLGFGHDFH